MGRLGGAKDNLMKDPLIKDSSMENDLDFPPTRYERAHVHDVYEAIAAHFSSTRYRAWPRVGAFLEALPPFAMIADVGCGNGKYFASAQRMAGPPRSSHVGPNPQCSNRTNRRNAPNSPDGNRTSPNGKVASLTTRRYVVGVDYSGALLRQAQREAADPNASVSTPSFSSFSSSESGRQPRTDTLRCDARQCPFRRGLFDAVISIAVIHHYATPQRRREAVGELLRLARAEGGLVLIYVWAREDDPPNDRNDKNRSGGKRRRSAAQRVDSCTGDALVPWEMNTRFRSGNDDEQQIFHRFYHFFSEGELQELCREAAKEAGVTVHVREAYYDKENWCILLEKS
ncbi:unnamed protein product [Phytomonas sp. Hart1]|nr:unnamed protein product [Phytomonas sp. Hart1]|eukprot:CCW66909.1 unnamed protein product [Phytomonas sp. isolate Hart1]